MVERFLGEKVSMGESDFSKRFFFCMTFSSLCSDNFVFRRFLIFHGAPDSILSMVSLMSLRDNSALWFWVWFDSYQTRAADKIRTHHCRTEI